MIHTKHPVFITRGKGYIGRRLIRILLSRGYEVIAFVRRQSISKLPTDIQRLLQIPLTIILMYILFHG